MLKKVIAATALVSFASAPLSAEAAVSRDVAPVEAKSELGGTGLIIGLLALAAVIAGIVIAADDGDEPVSA